MLGKNHFKKSRNRLEGHIDAPARQTPAPSVPDRLCSRCPGCKELLFDDDMARTLHVCPSCGHHLRLSAEQRVALFCDADSFTPWDEGLTSCDPLAFPGYAAKLKNGRIAGNGNDAVITGSARINGQPGAFFAMEASFMMGSMGSVVGEKITRCFERAAKERLPVVGFTVSGGARMQEGMLSLMQMAKTSGAVKLHSDAGLLYIAVLTDPTTGGVTASFAMEADVLLSEPGALIAFAGPRVIEQTLRQTLPKNFQRAEYLLEHGFLDAVIPRQKLKAALHYLLALHAMPAKAETQGDAP